jgi:endonuclease YncB( thermonuclease family)
MTLTFGTRAQHSRYSEETRVPMTSVMIRFLLPRVLLGALAALFCGTFAVSAAHAAAPAAPEPTSASAGTIPCVPGTAGPICQYWTGKVTFVDDGDTIDVDVDGDPSAKAMRIRVIGIQAMEQSSYSRVAARRRGDCHALEATARLEELIATSGGTVRLTAQDPESRNHNRLLRSVAVLIDGQWQDVGQALVAEGHALSFPMRTEWAWNDTYANLAQQAALAGQNLWNPDYCGGTPSALKLWVHWDAEGNDALRPDDEWVRVKNLDTQPVSLDGYTLRDSALNRFWFPLDTVVPAGGTITVQVGVGSGSILSWGLHSPIFDNVDDSVSMGDGAYLFDPAGDLRAWMQYPCRVNCTDPNQGAFDLRVSPSGRESVTLHNTSPATVDLDGYALTTGGHSYAFAPDTLVAPDDTLRVHLDGSPADDSATDVYWGATNSLLPNDAGAVRLTTFDGIVLACRAWGGSGC